MTSEQLRAIADIMDMIKPLGYTIAEIIPMLKTK